MVIGVQCVTMDGHSLKLMWFVNNSASLEQPISLLVQQQLICLVLLIANSQLSLEMLAALVKRPHYQIVLALIQMLQLSVPLITHMMLELFAFVC